MGYKLLGVLLVDPHDRLQQHLPWLQKRGVSGALACSQELGPGQAGHELQQPFHMPGASHPLLRLVPAHSHGRATQRAVSDLRERHELRASLGLSTWQRGVRLRPTMHLYGLHTPVGPMKGRSVRPSFRFSEPMRC